MEQELASSMAQLSMASYQTWWIVTVHSGASDDEVYLIITWLMTRNHDHSLMRLVKDSQLNLHIWLDSHEDAMEIMLTWS